jgi:hypothetical protein
VIEDFDPEQLAGTDEILRCLDVGFARGRIATGMIVLCAAPSYAQQAGRIWAVA